MNKKYLIIFGITIIVIGVASFYGGTKYELQRSPAQRGQQIRNNRVANFRPISGEIISIGENTITTKLDSGSSKIILFSPKTDINKAASVSATELKTGEKVSVVGQENTDGSVTAQSIQLYSHNSR